MRHLIATIPILGSLLLQSEPTLAQGQPEPAGPMVSLTLGTDVVTATPGQVIWLSVQFDIAPDWHIYWPGQNDTGIAPIFNWTLPDGWKIGQPRWPTPQRYDTNTDMLDHVLVGSPVVFFPVLVPKEATLGSRYEIEADVEWFVCRDICLAEYDTSKLAIRIAASSEPSTNAHRVRSLRAALPATWPAKNAPIAISRTETDTLTVSSSSPGVLAFYPYASGRGVLDLPAAQTRSSTLRIAFAPVSTTPIAGIVHFISDDGVSYAFEYRDPVEPDARRDGFETSSEHVSQESIKE